MMRTVLASAVAATAVLLGVCGVALAALSDEPGNTPQTDGVVFSVLPVGNRIYIGGDFTHVDGVPRNHLAAVDATTGELTGWAPNAAGSNGSIRALAASPDGSRIYVGGAFTSINGTYRGRLAAVDATTGALDTTWKPGTANGTVRAIAVSGDRLYAGGDFTSVQGQSRTRLALLDGATGALDANWAPTANDTVRALVFSPDSTRLYAGGNFTSMSGQPRNWLAALDPSNAGTPLPWRTLVDPNGTVFALATGGSSVYAADGGNGGAAEAYEAATGARAWQLRGDGDGQAITLMGDEVYVGGHFINFADQRRPFFTAVDAATGAVDAQWAPSGGGGLLSATPSTGVWALASDADRGRLYAGTNFLTVNGQPHAGFVQFTDSPGTPVDTAPPETTVTSGPSGSSESTSASFGFASTEPGSTFECSLDGEPYSACSSPQSYTGLSDGSHAFRVRATDAAGNVDLTPASLTWEVRAGDASGPAVTRPRPAPGSSTRDRTPTVGATVRDETTELEKADVSLFIDGERRAFSYDAETDRLSRATWRLSYGGHRVRVVAEDAAGNEARRAWSFRVVRGR